MSDTVWIQLILSLTTIITLWLKQSMDHKETKKKLDDQDKKLESVATQEKLEVVHKATNSNLEDVKENLRHVNDFNSKLIAEIIRISSQSKPSDTSTHKAADIVEEGRQIR